MKRALVVRPARIDDLEAIVELRLSLLREYADHPFYANLRPDARARAFEVFGAQLMARNEVMFVAERGERVIGVIRCVDTRTSPVVFPERYCYISSVYVMPADRRRGVLRALLGAAEAWCDERGISEMRLHNSSSSIEARASWDALGFDVVEEVRRRDVHPAPVTSSLPSSARRTSSANGAR